jgi:hypothetical protein
MKRYGIRVTLPPEDFLSSPHLLGRDWQGYRWFDSEQERDRRLEEMQALPRYYQRDEQPRQVLTKVEKDGP